MFYFHFYGAIVENKEETLLESFEFLKGDPRWEGAIDLVNRQVDQPDGSKKNFIDVRLRIGKGPKYTALPRRGLEQIVAAMQLAKPAADRHFEQRVLARSTQSAQQGRKQQRIG